MRTKAMPARWELACVVLITLFAAALRFYRLQEVPPGLHFDEAFKGVTARALVHGAPAQIFFESDMGEEPMAMYLVAAAIGLFGEEPWIIRLPSAVVGTLTVPLAWWLGRELVRNAVHSKSKAGKSANTQTPVLTGFEAQAIGLGSALVLAMLFWHLGFSRLGLEPILVPLVATVAIASLLRGLTTQRLLSFGLAGLALGGSLYTYKAGYFVPVLALVFIAYASLVERRFLRTNWRGLLVTAAVALVVAAPIGAYFATHLDNFMQRPSSVTVVGTEGTVENSWRAVEQNLTQVLGMFFVQGDANPRSNLPLRPALEPFLALLFAVGIGAALLRFRHAARLLPVLWLGVMIIPTLITQHAPHFGRAIGATPALALLCASGGWAVWRVAHRARSRWVNRAVALVLTLGLAFSAASAVRAYFGDWAQSPDLFHAYDVGLVEIAAAIDAVADDTDVYVTPTSAEHYTLQYLTHREFSSFDGRHGLVLPPPGRTAVYFTLLQEDSGSLRALQQIFPQGTVSWRLADRADAPYAVGYSVDAPSLQPNLAGEPRSSDPAGVPIRPADAIFGGAARLQGFATEDKILAPGDRLQLTLYWQVLEPLAKDYTVFAHLLGEFNPATGGPVWAGHDGQPDGGFYATSHWKPGQTVLDVHAMDVPSDAPPGAYQLEVGLYLLEDMSRLAGTSTTGATLPGDAVVLGTVQVGGPSHEP